VNIECGPQRRGGHSTRVVYDTYDSSFRERNLDAATGIHFLCGFHVEIGDGYLSCPLLRERPEGFPDNRVVPDLAAMTVTKDQNCGCVFFRQRRRLWRNLSSLCPQRLLLS